MVAAFAGIFICQLLGEFIVRAFALPLPGPVLGMFLLFAALLVRGDKGARRFQPSSDPPPTACSAIFRCCSCPPSVGLMRYFDLLAANAAHPDPGAGDFHGAGHGGDRRYLSPAHRATDES